MIRAAWNTTDRTTPTLTFSRGAAALGAFGTPILLRFISTAALISASLQAHCRASRLSLGHQRNLVEAGLGRHLQEIPHLVENRALVGTDVDQVVRLR